MPKYLLKLVILGAFVTGSVACKTGQEQGFEEGQEVGLAVCACYEEAKSDEKAREACADMRIQGQAALELGSKDVPKEVRNGRMAGLIAQDLKCQHMTQDPNWHVERAAADEALAKITTADLKRTGEHLRGQWRCTGKMGLHSFVFTTDYK